MVLQSTESKTITIVASITFIAGFICGYQVKSWRLKYLRAKKEYLMRRLNTTENQLNDATGLARKETI